MTCEHGLFGANGVELSAHSSDAAVSTGQDNAVPKKRPKEMCGPQDNAVTHSRSEFGGVLQDKHVVICGGEFSKC